MTDLATWWSKVDACLASDDFSGLGMRAGEWLGGSPFLGFLPLWSDIGGITGLMALPAVGILDCPVVRIAEGSAITLATNIRTALPRWLVDRWLSNVPQDAERLARAWPQMKDALDRLNEALGGTDRALREVEAIVLHPPKRNRFRFSSDRKADFEAAHSEVARAIEHCPEFDAYADWFDRLLDGKAYPLPTDADNWSRLTAGWAASGGSIDGLEQLDRNRLRALVTGFCGWDTGLCWPPSWSNANCGSSEANLWQTAQLLAFGDPAEDPADQALVEAVAEKGLSYDGTDHAIAAAVLDERGELERAWAALAAAQWWMSRAYGASPPANRTAALGLCERNGLDDLAWIISKASANR